MILVESDNDGDWDSRTDWPHLAERAVRAAIRHSRYAELIDSGLNVEVSVKFAGDGEVQALNAAYRNRDKATNVLSFPMLDPDLMPSIAKADSGEILLGDIVLAQGICAAEAEERGISAQDHASHLVVHGILHLLGYDHETGDADAEAMEAIEREALASIGIADPYPEEVRTQAQ